VIGTGLSGAASGQVDYQPDTDPLSLTERDKDQLIAAIPSSAKRRIDRATLFCPLNALESGQNTDRPTANENGLVTFRPVRRQGDVVDLQYEYTVDGADDLAELTQGHVHHAPRGESDNRLFFALYAFSDLDGSDGEPRDPPIRTRSTLSDQLARLRDADFDDSFRQADPAVPDLGDDFVAALSRDILASPNEYQINAHTLTFRTEAIRGQIRRAQLGRLSRRELVETVLATAGPDALRSDLPDVNGDGNAAHDPDGDGRYEDVNGDGDVNAGDAQALFDNKDSDPVQNDVDLFDFNDDGSVDVGDAQTLFEEL